MVRACLAGATDWAGSELARAVAKNSDLALVAAVSRKQTRRKLGEALGDANLACAVHATAAEALATPCDVFVEYTKPESAKANVLAALRHDAHVVIGASGLPEAHRNSSLLRSGRCVKACATFATRSPNRCGWAMRNSYSRRAEARPVTQSFSVTVISVSSAGRTTIRRSM